MFKEKLINKFWSILVLASCLLAQDSLNNGSNNVGQNVPTLKNSSGFVETTNRLPQLLKDVKILLTDAIIADVQGDTLEVIYNLDRIYELLSEADQLGEKTAEDKEEFDDGFGWLEELGNSKSSFNPPFKIICSKPSTSILI